MMETSRTTDPVLAEIADYVCAGDDFEPDVLQAASLCLMDALGCAIAAIHRSDCQRHLGPIVPNAVLPGGARVPGTAYELDPVRAAYNISAAIRWLDYNDTWLGTEWAHPSDNIGALLASADYAGRTRTAHAGQPVKMLKLLSALVRAYEIQGVLALSTQFNVRGFDHVLLVTIASTALSTCLLGGNRNSVIAALSQAFLDGVPLRLYRQAPATGPRKSWAAADASARGVFHALLALRGEPGYASVLSTPRYGFQDAIMGGATLRLAGPLGSYIVEHVLYKVAYPCEFHAQSAAEAAIQLHEELRLRITEISKITISTHAAAKLIIDKPGPLSNAADRDHCLQYIVAVALWYGALDYGCFEDAFAENPVIDELRGKMIVVEDESFTDAYHDPAKRAVANRITVELRDGRRFERTVEYPLGHPGRRQEALPKLVQKFANNVEGVFASTELTDLLALFTDPERLGRMSVDSFMNLWVRPAC
jgi:2-methylcitrate dehydratase